MTTYSWSTALRIQFVDVGASKLQKEEQEISVSGPYGQYLHFVFIAHKNRQLSRRFFLATTRRRVGRIRKDNITFMEALLTQETLLKGGLV